MKQDFKTLFFQAPILKKYITTFDNATLRLFKTEFYTQNLAIWFLDLIWEYFFDYKSYQEIEYVLRAKHKL